MMYTLDVISEILNSNPEIDLLTFSRFPQQTLIQKRIELSETDKELVAAAIDIRNKFRLPFWDSLMLSTFDKENVSPEVLSNAMLHNPNRDKIKTRDINGIRELLMAKPHENLSLNSEVYFKNNVIKHFFLLDFHVFPSANNLIIVSDILDILDLHGYILNSGESYHFLSDSFFEVDSLIDLLAKSMLFSPIVDNRWIAHQMIERSCSLRVGEKHSIAPTVIKKI